MSTGGGKAELVQRSTKNGVLTVTMNNPKRLNGWTEPMMKGIFDAFKYAKDAPDVRAVVVTGADPYYCAGVNLSGSLKPMHPKDLFKMIENQNRNVFEQFLLFPKPLVIAVNGPAIGASVTTATLCDAVVASDKATFSTPFTRLGIPPEGCSSVNFARLMGEETAQRMLGPEGWVPTGAEAVEVGLIDKVVPHEELMEAAQAEAEAWARDVDDGKRQKRYVENGLLEEMRQVNIKESHDLATAFLSKPFLDGQAAFLDSKGKTQPALMFKVLSALHPLWSRML